VSEDGTLTVLDYINERVPDIYRSYFGALLCVTWSPDGRYIVTGSQDDLVSIWSFGDRELVARCSGHDNYVRDVKFDPWRCDERNYRFGSVGADRRLLLWDFSVGMLARPKAASIRPRGSISSSVAPALTRERTQSTVGAGRFRSQSSLSTQPDTSTQGEETVIHSVDPRANVPSLPPVMSKIVDEHPVAWLGFEEGRILTSCDNGKSALIPFPLASATSVIRGPAACCALMEQANVSAIRAQYMSLSTSANVSAATAHVKEWDRPKEGAGEDSVKHGTADRGV